MRSLLSPPTTRVLLLLPLVALLSGSLAADLRWRGEVVSRVTTPRKVVALTFDDGPSPSFTPAILRILAGWRQPATFFMVGSQVERYPAVARAVTAAGHAVGNHTGDHPRDLTALPAEQVRAELRRGSRALRSVLGTTTTLFRPPYGSINGSVERVAAEEGYRTLLWTVCADHHDAPTPAAMAQRVLRQLRPGAIVLFHDGDTPNRWKDVAALPLVLQPLLARGYRCVTVPELLRSGEAHP